MFAKHVSEWATNLRAAIKTSIVVAIGKVVPHDKIFRFLYSLLIQYCLLQFLNDSPPYFAVEENTDDTTHSRQYIVLGCWKDCSSSHFRPTIMRVSRSDSPKDSLKDKYNNLYQSNLKKSSPKVEPQCCRANKTDFAVQMLLRTNLLYTGKVLLFVQICEFASVCLFSIIEQTAFILHCSSLQPCYVSTLWEAFKSVFKLC